ncbi:MAG: hypothetical protein EHM21_00705 [Chloroflexi bacterium]|nr:MAG: hypothetical protein EHM21_00705 [Chloroflexota bacterium]
MWAILVIILLFTAWFQISIMWKYSTDREDISFLYLDGHRVLFGENPYVRVLEGDMRDNNKYTTYFPAFIELSFVTQRYYFREYGVWLALWRWIFLLCYLGMIILLFWWGKSVQAPLLAIFSALLWTFNRWTLYLQQVSGMDILPIFCLLISLYLLTRKHALARWGSWAFFGLSLALKQIAIFLFPLYLIYEYHRAENHKLRQVLVCAASIVAIPLLSSLPFMVQNLNGFLLSILFSLTRSSQQFPPSALSLDMFLGLADLPARIPMIVLMLAIYAAAWQYANRVKINTSSMLIFLIFVSFNPILFNQYVPWFILLIPLALFEWMTTEKVGETAEY